MKHLYERRSQLVAEMTELAAKPDLSDEQRSRFDTIEGEIARLDRTLDVGEARSAPPAGTTPSGDGGHIAPPAGLGEEGRGREPGAAPRIEVNEPDMYGKFGQRSWFGDLVRVQKHGDSRAEERMHKHAQLENERRSKARRDADAWRGMPEYRDMEMREGGHAGTIVAPGAEARGLVSSSDAAGGYLVPPADLNELYVDEVKNLAIAASLVTNLPLPDGVQLIRLPKIATATTVAIHTQGNTISKTDATFGQATATVYRLAGGQDISNFLLQRGTPALDILIMKDLAGENVELLDSLVLHGTNSSQPKGITKHAELGSKTVTYDDASPTYPELYPKYIKAVNKVAELRKRWPEATLAAPRRTGWIQGQLDSTGRPYIGAFAPMNALGSGLTPAAAGLRSNIGGVDVYNDGNMRTNRGAGADEDDIVTGVFSDALLWTAPVMFGISREEKFSSDQTVVKVAQDMAFMPDRRADSFWVVQGTGLLAVL